MREGSSQESSLRGAGERMTVNDLFTLISVPFFRARFLSLDPEGSSYDPEWGLGTRTLQGESLQDEPQRGRMSPIKGGEV